MTKQNKKCVICEKEIKPDPDYVLDAIICTSRGNYGSSIFDPMPFDTPILKHLVFYICDDCLKSKSNLFQYEEVIDERKTISSKSFNKILEKQKEKK